MMRCVAGWAGLFALTVAGCGPWNVKPECRAAYDACVDGCGPRCGAPAPGARTDAPEMTDTWTQGCSACEHACRDTRDRCNR